MREKTFYLIAIILAFLYFIPPFIHLETQPKPGIKLGLPSISDRENSIYLVTLSSIVEDFDLELKNNYYNASFQNGYSAGVVNRGKKYQVHWTKLYNQEGEFIGSGFMPDYYIDAVNSGKYKTFDGKIIGLDEIKEYSATSVAMPILVSPFLWPFRGSSLLEPAAILLTVFVSLIGIYFLYKILLFYSQDKNSSLFIACCFALATPLWHYSGRFIKEIYIVPVCLASYYLFFVKKRVFYSGLLLALAFYIKHPIFIFAPALLVHKIASKKYKEALLFCLPFVPIIGLISATSTQLTGFGVYLDYARIYAPYLLSGAALITAGISLALTRKLKFILPFGVLMLLFVLYRKEIFIFNYNFLKDNFSYLLSPKFGLITFAPFILFAFLGIPKFLKYHPKDALVTYTNILLYYLFYLYMSYYYPSQSWWQDEVRWEWASRMLLVILPFFALSLIYWFTGNKNKGLKIAFYMLVIVSFVINLIGAFASKIVRTQDIFLVFYKSWEILGRVLLK